MCVKSRIGRPHIYLILIIIKIVPLHGYEGPDSLLIKQLFWAFFLLTLIWKHRDTILLTSFSADNVTYDTDFEVTLI